MGTTPKPIPKRTKDVLAAGSTCYVLLEGGGLLTQPQAKKVQEYLVSEARNEASKPVRDGSEQFRPVLTRNVVEPGTVAVTAEDDQTQVWLTRKIDLSPSLWVGCRLKLTPKGGISERKAIQGVIPSPVPTKGKLLSILEKQNPKLLCKDWSITSYSSDKRGTFVRFQLTKDAYQALQGSVVKSTKPQQGKAYRVYEGGRFITLKEC